MMIPTTIDEKKVVISIIDKAFANYIFNKPISKMSFLSCHGFYCIQLIFYVCITLFVLEKIIRF